MHNMVRGIRRDMRGLGNSDLNPDFRYQISDSLFNFQQNQAYIC